MRSSPKRPVLNLVLVLLPLALLLGSLGVGAYQISLPQALEVLWRALTRAPQTADRVVVGLVLDVRLPRILAAAMVGVGLAVSGSVFQGLFGNPLADPYTLGVSNGAGFGAGLAIVLSLPSVVTQLSAMGFGMAAVGLTFLLSARSPRSSVTLVLSGMLVSALFSSLVALLKFTADPFEKLPQIVFWLMGSLVSVSYGKLLLILPAYAAALAVLLLYRWRINVLSMGSREARSFGVDVRRDRTVVILASTLLTAMVVSVAGIIGWVGIVIPHLARMLVGPDFRRLMPASASLGICYLLVIDNLCRTLTATEIPIGVITGIVGIPLFVYFIYRKKVSW